MLDPKRKPAGVWRLALLVWAGLMMVSGPLAWAGPQRALSPQELDKFMVDWPRFATWAREHGEEFDRPTASDDIFEELLGRQALGFIKSMGWEADRFSYVLERITAILSGLGMREHREKIRAAHEAERIEINNNPDLTESDRVARLEAVAESWARMEEFGRLVGEADEGEVELVKTYKKRLMKIFKKIYRGF